jgi:integrase/recombinase XerD
MNQFPCLIRSSSPGGEVSYALGDPLVDSYLAFVAGRCRPNTLRAVAHDLKTFFAVIDKDPVEVVAADVFDFVADQRGDRTVVRIADGESGCRLARSPGGCRRSRASTRIWSLVATRRSRRTRCRVGCRRVVAAAVARRCRWCGCRARCPRSSRPGEVTALLGALRTTGTGRWSTRWCWAGCAAARSSVLRLGDVQVPERSLFIAEGKGGHQRVIPISNTFFVAVGDYLRHERPRDVDTDRVFVTLKGPTRGRRSPPMGSTRSCAAPGTGPG